jgi:hypothetical protein
MKNNGHERITDTEQLANGTPEVERPREQQQALTRTPQSNDLPVKADVENDKTDEAHPTDPGNRGRASAAPPDSSWR